MYEFWLQVGNRERIKAKTERGNHSTIVSWFVGVSACGSS